MQRLPQQHGCIFPAILDNQLTRKPHSRRWPILWLHMKDILRSESDRYEGVLLILLKTRRRVPIRRLRGRENMIAIRVLRI